MNAARITLLLEFHRQSLLTKHRFTLWSTIEYDLKCQHCTYQTEFTLFKIHLFTTTQNFNSDSAVGRYEKQTVSRESIFISFNLKTYRHLKRLKNENENHFELMLVSGWKRSKCGCYVKKQYFLQHANKCNSPLSTNFQQRVVSFSLCFQ